MTQAADRYGVHFARNGAPVGGPAPWKDRLDLTAAAVQSETSR